VKIQTSRSRIQRSSGNQASTQQARRWQYPLVLGIWCLSGSWFLDLGASTSRLP
jgi:hypothetical protein